MAEKIGNGITKHPLYQTWANMKNRCYNTKTPDYPNWGGRGIKVCDRWLSSQNFIADLKDSYEKGLTLDRKDVNGDYTPENCRWVNRQVQNNNRRDNNLIEYNGKSQTLSVWARELGIKRSTLSMRYYKYNWDINRLFSQVRSITQ